MFFVVSRVVSAAGAFLYPTYASYKTLSRRPASEPDLERWLMYWSVLGALLALEYVAEWAVRWLPFYYPLKTLFLLYLAFPHTRGATFIYKAHLHPAISAHEDAIDSALRHARDASVQWAQRRLRAFVAALTGSAYEIVEGDESVGGVRGAAGSAAPPTLADPVSGPANIAYGLWRTYAVPALTTFVQPALTSVPRSPPTPRTPPRTPPAVSRHPSHASPPRTPPHESAHTSALDLDEARAALLARRRALEAELASLPLPSSAEAPSASAYLPAQGDDHDNGRYEEIAHDEATDLDDEDHDLHPAGPMEDQQSWSSWLWGSRPDGYQRLKTE